MNTRSNIDSRDRSRTALHALMRAVYITIVFDLAVVVAGLIVYAAGPFKAAHLTRWLVTAVIVAGGAVALRVFTKRPFSAVALAGGALVGAIIAHFGFLIICALLGGTGHFDYLMMNSFLGTPGRFGGVHLADLLLLAAIWNGGVFLGALGGLCMTAGESPGLRRNTRRVIVWTATILIGMALALYGGLWYLALSKESAVNGRWARDGMPIAGYLEGLTRTKQNASADRLLAIGAQWGLSSRSSDKGKARDTDAASRKRWDKARFKLQQYVETELQKPGPQCAAPDEVTAAYLCDSQPEIAEVRGLLLKEIPVWGLQLDGPWVSSIPDLLMQMNLTRILVADALNAYAGGRDGVALADVDAAWRLSEPLGSRPELISQLLLLTMREMDMAALRKLNGAPPLWQRRLEAWHPRQGLVSALRAKAASWELLPRLMGKPSFAGLLSGGMKAIDDRFVFAFSQPYYRWSAADSAGRQLSVIEGEQKIGECASPEQVRAPEKRLEESFPWWNYPGRMCFPRMGAAWLRVDDAAIQKELTDKVLQLKAARAANHAWPKDVPGIEKSPCPHEHWNYVLLPGGGGMSLTFSDADFLKTVRFKKRSYPLEYREAPR